MRYLAWREMISDLENGRVLNPLRRLLAAAWAEYPGNTVFRGLGRRHGLPDPR
jgi:hypothetical protein